MNVLVLNSGSSSQKSCLYEVGDSLPENPPGSVWEGKIEWADDKAQYSIKNSGGASRQDLISVGSREEAIERLLGSLWSGKTQAISGPSAIDVVGHRVVHGGPQHFEPSIVTAEVKSAIESVSVFAPLHNRAELEGMEIVAKKLGAVPQIAVFDTGFHRTMPLSAATYPGPYHWFEQGIRRYGFHGINHQYCRTAARQGPEFPETRDLPLGKWLLFGGDFRGSKRGYHDGLHSTRGSHDGHPLGFSGSWHPYISDSTETVLEPATGRGP